MKNNTLSKSRGVSSRVMLGIAAAVASTVIIACAASGHVDARGEIKPPLIPPVKWAVSATLGEYTIDGGESRANLCVEVTWTGADGAVISSETSELDGSGTVSGQVPAGSVRWIAKLVDCPEPEPEPEEKGAGSGGGSWAGGAFGPLAQQGVTLGHLREFLVYGAPIVPSDDLGEDNLTYSFIVQARSWAQADSLIAPIISGGIGTPVSPNVQVLSFTTVEADLAGGRVVSAMPGRFTDYSLDFNDGAFTADLSSAHNTLNYQAGSWDVVEVVVSQSAFDFGLLPGVTYSNAGTATFMTDQLQGPVHAGYEFNYSN